MKIKILKKTILDHTQMYWGLMKRKENLIICSQGIHIESLEEVYSFYNVQNYHKKGTILKSWPCDCQGNEGHYEVDIFDYIPCSLSDDVLKFFGAEVKIGEGEIVFLSLPDFGIEDEEQYKIFLPDEVITWNQAKAGKWLKHGEEYEFLEKDKDLKFRKRIVKNLRGKALIVKEEENPEMFRPMRKRIRKKFFKRLFS